MFRIRHIRDAAAPASRRAIAAAQAILREQFPLVSEREVASLPAQLGDPFDDAFLRTLFVAEDGRGAVRGFALLLHDPRLGFAYLDFVAAASGRVAGGVGGALYERVREVAREAGAYGLFMECLPDDPALSREPAIRAQNAARLRFYERFGARPLEGTAYETPLKPGGDNPPYLVFDDLGSGAPLPRARALEAVRAILERKYAGVCPPDYNRRVLESFRDDPVRVRAPRYTRASAARGPSRPVARSSAAITLVVNDRHEIHHVRERGYVEAPVRVASILDALLPTRLFARVEPLPFPDRHVLAVHDRDFVSWLERACAGADADESIYPYVFPIRNVARPPVDLGLRAGYFCIDTFTPIHRNAWPAARRAVDCALTAASALLDDRPLAYALVRPPGHHAERRAFGGFCYLNSNAVAAHFLSEHGRVAVLDVDYHHGNGQQQIFYERRDVLTVSLHGHPRFAYPYFTGFADETGAGDGVGFNVNVPLPEALDGAGYLSALRRALGRIAEFEPAFLVVALGLDTARGDPTGSWTLGAADFAANGRAVGALRLPTLVVQEGGYRTRSLGASARAFFEGLCEGAGVATR